MKIRCPADFKKEFLDFCDAMIEEAKAGNLSKESQWRLARILTWASLLEVIDADR